MGYKKSNKCTGVCVKGGGCKKTEVSFKVHQKSKNISVDFTIISILFYCVPHSGGIFLIF